MGERERQTFRFRVYIISRISMKLKVIDWHIPLVGGVATGHNLLQSLSLRCESLSDVIVLLISRRWGGDALGGAGWNLGFRV